MQHFMAFFESIAGRPRTHVAAGRDVAVHLFFCKFSEAPDFFFREREGESSVTAEKEAVLIKGTLDSPLGDFSEREN